MSEVSCGPGDKEAEVLSTSRPIPSVGFGRLLLFFLQYK
jgi:hypothetical protein